MSQGRRTRNAVATGRIQLCWDCPLGRIVEHGISNVSVRGLRGRRSNGRQGAATCVDRVRATRARYRVHPRLELEPCRIAVYRQRRAGRYWGRSRTLEWDAQRWWRGYLSINPRSRQGR
jgi:hypothetical protein